MRAFAVAGIASCRNARRSALNRFFACLSGMVIVTPMPWPGTTRRTTHSTDNGALSAK
jgi:hypothetical protein